MSPGGSRDRGVEYEEHFVLSVLVVIIPHPHVTTSPFLALGKFLKVSVGSAALQQMGRGSTGAMDGAQGRGMESRLDLKFSKDN